MVRDLCVMYQVHYFDIIIYMYTLYTLTILVFSNTKSVLQAKDVQSSKSN